MASSSVFSLHLLSSEPTHPIQNSRLTVLPKFKVAVSIDDLLVKTFSLDFAI